MAIKVSDSVGNEVTKKATFKCSNFFVVEDKSFLFYGKAINIYNNILNALISSDVKGSEFFMK